ncbi:MAG: ABC transporter ATP-binding protein [Oscillospiraceae bacterium]|nr:ABC transporter ATP-binding protein [Oscillospiraceae bacterium]
MVYYGDQYYLVRDLDPAQKDELSAAAAEELEDVSVSDGTLTVRLPSGSEYRGRLLSHDELVTLRRGDYSGIKRIALIYTIVLLITVACDLTRQYLLQKLGQDVIFTIRQEVFEHVHTLHARFFDTNPVGRIVTRVTNDVESLNQMYTQVIINLFSNSVLILGYAIVMLGKNWRLALLCFAFLPVIFVLTLWFRKLARKVYRIVRTKVSSLNTFLSENISGMKLIQLFAREDVKADEFKERTGDLYKSQMRELKVMSVFRPVIAFLSNAALAVILWRSGVSVLAGTLTLGTLYVFSSYIRSFFEPIQDLAETFSVLQNALASAEKIFTILDEENPIKEPENPTVLPSVKGRIEFKNVWFAYEGEDYVLRDVSFVIEPGQKVAFVGATGAGKSSILNLIGRYYDIQKGQILLDGVDIRELSTSQIRGAIGQVQQDVFVFTGDIKSNIRLSDESITDEDVRAAAHAVNADRFIESLPAQYDEPVTERGSTLSAGQRQLLSFARTLAYKPRILVMDEATANIDTETEQLIQGALETLMEGRTTIMVAHRLSTIQHADNIIVMHKGRIRESGTHQQLLEMNGIYKKLYELQQ